VSTESTDSAQGAKLVDRIAQDIRQGFYHPRQRLIESDLRERYEASRTSVRDALIELTALGLVEREAKRGARVRRVSNDEAIYSTEVRLTLQALCARHAAVRITDQDRVELQDLVAQLRAAVDEGDRARNATANSEISRVIRRISGHKTASRMIETLQSQVPLNLYPFQLPDRRVESMHEFEQIVEAVVAGDEQAALAAGHRHRDNVLAALRVISSDG
jgi:DNA-binding GntR family transcriptional regulator